MDIKHAVSGLLLAGTIGLTGWGWANAPLNTVNDGRIIKGGTYYNTPGNATSFTNSRAGGLWLKSGVTVRGLEADANGVLNNNGGTLHLYAPEQVVRLDGNINVNALRNNQGAYLGNGGRLFVDSAYLFQNGNIYANGVNGGLVQVNVAGMTLGVGAQIQARGSTGAGGTVAINASGPVDLRRASVIDTSGKVLGALDGNLINIEGGLVNNDGALRANGIDSRGGSIRLVASGQSPYQEIKSALKAATVNPPGDTTSPTISGCERIFLLQRIKSLINHHEGQVVLSRNAGSKTTPAFISSLSANGTGPHIDPRNDYTQNTAPRAGDGGNISLLAMQGIQNLGSIQAKGAAGASGANPVNGGNGGTISMLSQAGIDNAKGRLEANGGRGGSGIGNLPGGNGGNGGLIAFGYNGPMHNSGGIYADGAVGGSAATPGRGGNGGLILFSGNSNPTGNGSIDTIGRPGGNQNLTLGGKSGTIISPCPTTLGQAQVYFQQGYVNGQWVRSRATQQTQPVELLTHAENLIMLTKNGDSRSAVSDNLFTRLTQATIRSVEDPTGALGQAREEVINKNTASSPFVFRNLILGSSRDNTALALNHPRGVEPGGGPGVLIFPSALSRGAGFTTLNTLSLLNNGPVSTQILQGLESDGAYLPTDFWLIGRNSNSLAGSRISALASGDIVNLNVWGTTGVASGGSVHIASGGTFDNNALLTTGSVLHGGSMILKAENNVINNETLYYSVGEMASNGGVIGGNIQILPKHDFNYTGGPFLSSITANGSLQGGILEINAGHDSIFDVNDPITANGTSPTLGRGGFIHIHAANNNVHNGVFEATGGLKNGQVIFTTGSP